MDIRQLNALTAVADHGTFSAAAKALHTVQSNISSHISHLERELGVALVDRAHGVLTQEGEAVVARARRIHAELDALAADVTSLGEEISGPVRLGMISTSARWLARPLLTALHEAHPKIRAVVVEGNTTSLSPLLVAGTLDLAVFNLPDDAGSDLVAEPLFDEQMLLIAPTGHPLAEMDAVTVADLAGHPILLAPPGTPARDELDAEAARLGVTLTAQAEIDGVRLIASLAMEGFGPAVLPATTAPAWFSGPWRRVPINGLRPRRVSLVRRRRGLLSAPARALGEVLAPVIVAQSGPQVGVEVLVGQPGLDDHRSARPVAARR